MTDKPVFSLDQIINQLRTSWGGDYEGHAYSWSGTEVTYGFVTQTMNDYEIGFAREAFALWDDLIAINLTELPLGVNIAFYYGPIPGKFAGQTDFDPNQSTLTWANTEINENVADDAVRYGLDGFQTYIHEIGHALGLSHPGSYNGGAEYGPDAEYVQDTLQYTVMSYFDAGSDIGNTAIHFDRHTNTLMRPATPMLDDIAAVQAVYGADMTTRIGDDVYGFNASFSGPYRGAFDFTQNTAPVVAIWDAGGNDTLDCSGFNADQTIYLHAGSYSSVGGLTDNVAIAYNCIIENAIGGSGSDTITGNEVNNRLEGGPGDDTLFGAAGVDNLLGGPGDDVLDGGPGGDIMIGGPGDDQYY